MDGKDLPRLALAGLFIVIAVQIGGFALLWSKDAPPPEYVYMPVPADKTSAASPTTAPVVVVSPPDEKALRKIIQTVLEQELASYMRQMEATPRGTRKDVDVTVSVPIKENSPENIQAYTEASSVVDNALASGQWSADLNFKLQVLNKNLTPEQHSRLLDKVGQAVMNKQLIVEGNNFPIF